MKKFLYIKDEQYINIASWMITKYGLKGNDLLLFALIYGYTQHDENDFYGSLEYMAEWTNSSKQSVQKNLANLIDMGVVTKSYVVKNGKKRPSYRGYYKNNVTADELMINLLEAKILKETDSEVKEKYAKELNKLRKCIENTIQDNREQLSCISTQEATKLLTTKQLSCIPEATKLLTTKQLSCNNNIIYKLDDKITNNLDYEELKNSSMGNKSESTLTDTFDLQLSEIDKAILEQMERDSRSYLESDECLREMSNYFQADDESEDNFFDYSETQFNLDGATESSDNLSLTTDGNSETCMDKSPVAQEFQTPEKERKSPRQKKENKAVDSAKQKTTKRSKFTIQNENDSKFAKTDYESVLNAYHDNRKRLFSKNLIRISDEDYVFNYKMIMSLIKNSFEAYGVDKVIQAVKDSIKYGWLYQDGNDYPINYIFGKNILPNLINHNYGISFEKRTTPVNNYSASAPEDYKGWDDWGD